MNVWYTSPLDTREPLPLHAQVKRAILQGIDNGALPLGAKLPSTRQMAESFGVHRLTINKAVNALTKRGILKSVPGKGIFVTNESKQPSGFDESLGRFFEGIAEGPLPESIQNNSNERLEGFMRQSLSHRQISFAAGFPPEEIVPTDALLRLINQATKSANKPSFTYADPAGDPGLIEQITAYLFDRGYRLGNDDRILITAGCQEALSLCLECFFGPTSGLAIESPGYMGIIAGCRLRRIPMYPVPVESGGIHPSRVASHFASKEAVGLYTIPNFQNPTGVTQQLRRRTALLDTAVRHDAIILEDDIYADIRFGGRPIPPIKSLKGGERVMYIGSFSKSLAPGLRVGFIVATGEYAHKLACYKATWDISTNTLSQQVVAMFLSTGAYQRHLRRLKRVYKERRDAMLASLDKHLGQHAVFTRPKGGMHTWVMLNRSTDIQQINGRAEASGILIAPSHLFFTDERNRSAFRLNFAANPPNVIEAGIERLSRIIKEEME